jgi:hypothetical protein
MQAAPLWQAGLTALIPALLIYGLSQHNAIKDYFSKREWNDLEGFIEKNYPQGDCSKTTHFLWHIGFTLGPMIGIAAGAFWAYSQGQPFAFTEGGEDPYGILPNAGLGGTIGLGGGFCFPTIAYLLYECLYIPARDLVFIPGHNVAVAAQKAALGLVKKAETQLGKVVSLNSLFTDGKDTWDPEKYRANARPVDFKNPNSIPELLYSSLSESDELRAKTRETLLEKTPKDWRDALYKTSPTEIQTLVTDMVAALQSPKPTAAFKASVLYTLEVIFSHVPEQDPGEILAATLSLLNDKDFVVRMLAFSRALLPNCRTEGLTAVTNTVLAAFREAKKSNSHSLAFALCLYLRTFADFVDGDDPILALLEASLPYAESDSEHAYMVAREAHTALLARLTHAGRSRYLTLLAAEIDKIPAVRTLTKGQKNRFKKLSGLVLNFFNDLDVSEQRKILALLSRYEYAFDGHVLDDFIPLIAPEAKDTSLFVKNSHRRFVSDTITAFTGRDVTIDMGVWIERFKTGTGDQDLARTLDDLLIYPNSDKWSEALVQIEVLLSIETNVIQRRAVVDRFVADLSDSRKEVRDFCAKAVVTVYQRVLNAQARKPLHEKLTALAGKTDEPETARLAREILAHFDETGTSQESVPVGPAVDSPQTASNRGETTESARERLHRAAAAQAARTTRTPH